jgi:hypothetical protein
VSGFFCYRLYKSKNLEGRASRGRLSLKFKRELWIKRIEGIVDKLFAEYAPCSN